MAGDLLESLYKSLVDGILDEVESYVNKLLTDGTPSKEILDAMVRGMEEVGRRYEAKEYFLPDMILAGQAMKSGIAMILPTLRMEGIKFRGKIILGSVEGDVHDLGKSIVASFLAGAGYEVIDLGIEVRAETFVQKVQETNPDIIGASAYMTTTTAHLPEVNDALKKAGVRDKVKFIIGGAATSEGFVKWSGADGWAETAVDAVKLVNKLLER